MSKRWDCPKFDCDFQIKWDSKSSSPPSFETLSNEMKAHMADCERLRKMFKESPEEKSRLERVAQRAQEEKTESGNFLCQCTVCVTGKCMSGWLEINGAYRSRGHVQKRGEYEKFVHGN